MAAHITQEALQAAVAAALAHAAANAPPPAPAAQPAVTFALSPAQAFDDVINFRTPAGADVYARGTASLPTKFTFDEPNIPILINQLTTRTAECNWEELFDIPTDNGNKNLLTQYGQITRENCYNHVATYITGQTRRVQNNYMLFECLTNSLDSDSNDKLSQVDTKYRHGTRYDGVSCLHTILTKAEASSRATASAIRKQLSKLSEYMKETAKDNVSKFNEYVRKQNRRLTGLGQESTDLIDNMLEAYRSIRDEEFKNFISHIKNEYEMGRRNLTLDELLNETESKYNILMTRGEWKERTSDQEEIIALRAQIDTLKKKNSGGGNKKNEQSGKKGNDTKKKKGVKKYTGKEAWRNDPPKRGEPNTKTIDGKEWMYCRYHKWNLSHLTKGCKVLHGSNAEETKKDKETPTANAISAAMADVGVQDVHDTQE